MIDDKTPSILEQTKHKVWFVDFGKAATPDIRFFNSTLVAHQGKEWLICRKSSGKPKDGWLKAENDLVSFLLDENRKPTHFVPINLTNRSYRKQHFEDPRASVIGGYIWLSFCTFQILGTEHYSGAHQQVTTLNEWMQPATAWSPVYGGNGGSLNTGSGQEKNWTWFEHDGRPHLLYHIDPHTVVEWKGQEPTLSHVTPSTLWDYGQARGGTPPVQIEPGGDYTVFFHSSTPWKAPKMRYHMGAYQFEPRPPFSMTRMTRKPILSGSQHDPWQDGLPLVVFPCGSTFCNGKWVISMGVNDYCTALMELPHEDLLKRMRKIQQ